HTVFRPPGWVISGPRFEPTTSLDLQERFPACLSPLGFLGGNLPQKPLESTTKTRPRLNTGLNPVQTTSPGVGLPTWRPWQTPRRAGRSGDYGETRLYAKSPWGIEPVFRIAAQWPTAVIGQLFCAFHAPPPSRARSFLAAAIDGDELSRP